LRIRQLKYSPCVAHMRLHGQYWLCESLQEPPFGKATHPCLIQIVPSQSIHFYRSHQPYFQQQMRSLTTIRPVVVAFVDKEICDFLHCNERQPCMYSGCFKQFFLRRMTNKIAFPASLHSGIWPLCSELSWIECLA
jgi:hypothetical protein